MKGCNLNHETVRTMNRSHYLGLDLYLQNGAYDGQCVADNDQDVPTVHKLQPVRHWDFLIAVRRVLLLKNKIQVIHNI